MTPPPPIIQFEERGSSSPYVERVWRSRSQQGGPFLAMAQSNIELVFTRLPGFTAATLRGPMARGSIVECPAQGEWLAIRFSIGTYLPHLPTAALMREQAMDLPVLSRGRFWLGGEAWEIPCYDSAEQLVVELAAHGTIRRSHAAEAVLEGNADWMSRRTVQRHMRQFTGMTISGHQQIQRARLAANLLTGGSSILNATFEAGYFDQAHLTRSLTRLIGLSPARILREQPQLSFSSKTS